MRKLQNHLDDTGAMIVFENSENESFQARRLFCIYGVSSDSKRGNHANINSEFLMICLKGHVKIGVFDGKTEKEYVLRSPEDALYIPRMIWKTMYDFSEEAVLLVLSDQLYDADEYIRDFEEYIGVMKNNEETIHNNTGIL